MHNKASIKRHVVDCVSENMIQKYLFNSLFIRERERELGSRKKFIQNKFIYYSCKLIRVARKRPSHEMSNVSKPMPLE